MGAVWIRRRQVIPRKGVLVLKIPRWLIIVLAVIVVAGIGYAVFTLTRPSEEPEVMGEKVKVERDSIESIVTVSGTTALSRQAKIILRIRWRGSRIASRRWRPGRTRAGDRSIGHRGGGWSSISSKPNRH